MQLSPVRIPCCSSYAFNVIWHLFVLAHTLSHKCALLSAKLFLSAELSLGLQPGILFASTALKQAAYSAGCSQLQNTALPGTHYVVGILSQSGEAS